MSKIATNILENCTGVSWFLTAIIKVNSGAISWGGAHVTAVQSSCHFSLLASQGFSSRGSDQQPATDTQMNLLRRTRLDQMHIVKEAQAVTPGLRKRSVLTFLPLAHYIITHSSLLCRTAAIFTHTNTHIRHQTDVPCPHGPTESKTPFQTPAVVDWTRLSISLHTRTHRACLCGPRTRANATPKSWRWASSSQGFLQSKSNKSRMSSFEQMLCGGLQWRGGHIHAVSTPV